MGKFLRLLSIFTLTFGLSLTTMVGCSMLSSSPKNNKIDPKTAVLQLKPHYTATDMFGFVSEFDVSCSSSQIKYKNKYYILTAKHCVESKASSYGDMSLLYVHFEGTQLNAEAKYWVISENADVAVLPLTRPLLKNSLDVAENDAEFGDTVYLTGYPLGVTDQISRQGLAKSMTIDWYGGKAQLVQLTIAPGDSGGSVINGNNEVVGILVAGDTRGNFMGFMVPVSVLKVLLGDL